MLGMPDALSLMALGDRNLSPVRRDDALLAGFYSELSEEDAAGLTLQERESRLLEIWQTCFGGDLDARASCPACGAALDVRLVVADLRQQAVPVAANTGMRSPTGHDLRAIEACRDLEQARARLLARCGLEVEAGADAMATLAAANPLADLQIALSCALCGHAWEAGFAAGAFVWSRVERLAAGLVQQVHALAQGYHWSEAAILAMPERRRARYLSALENGARA